MPQSLSKIYVHLTFSAKNRYPFIDDVIKNDLWEYLDSVCRGLECNPICVGRYNDHIHICCLLSKKITQIKFIEEVKKQSSKWIKVKGERYSKFYWQDNYGIFSVNPSKIDRVVKYINYQAEHHKRQTFQSELSAFLKKYNAEYDERYLWN